MLLHIYGQDHWHDEAYIVGDDEGLRRLRAALDRALASGVSAAQAFPCDGEGYRVFAVKMDDERMEQLALPYCSLRSEHGKHPMSMISMEDHDKGVTDARKEHMSGT